MALSSSFTGLCELEGYGADLLWWCRARTGHEAKIGFDSASGYGVLGCWVAGGGTGCCYLSPLVSLGSATKDERMRNMEMQQP